MATDSRGFAVPVTGWTGHVELTALVGGPATVAASGRVSALAVWAALATAARAAWPAVTWTWSLTHDGVLTLLASDGSYTLELTGTTQARLGFDSASYAGTNEWTADNRAVHTIAPGAIAYTLKVPRGERGDRAWGAGSAEPGVPSTDLTRPVLQLTLTETDMQRLAEAWAVRRYPGTVDVYVHPETVEAVHVTTYRSQRIGILGHSRVSIGGVGV